MEGVKATTQALSCTSRWVNREISYLGWPVGKDVCSFRLQPVHVHDRYKRGLLYCICRRTDCVQSNWKSMERCHRASLFWSSANPCFRQCNLCARVASEIPDFELCVQVLEMLHKVSRAKVKRHRKDKQRIHCSVSVWDSMWAFKALLELYCQACCEILGCLAPTRERERRGYGDFRNKIKYVSKRL